MSLNPITLNTTRGSVTVTGATCWAEVVEVLREAVKVAESGEPRIQFPDDSGFRAGVPRVDWPAGLYYNMRTSEFALVDHGLIGELCVSLPSVQRGYGGSTEVEAYPVDAWVRLKRKEAACA